MGSLNHYIVKIRKNLDKLEKFQPSPLLAYFLISIATFLWASSIVILRGVREEYPPVGLSTLRWLVGGIFLLPFVWQQLIEKGKIIRSNMGLIFLLGLLQVGSSTALAVALNFTTAINGSVINASQPAITALIAWLIIKEKLSPLQAIGILIGLIGVIVIIFRSDIHLLISMELNLGDGLAIVAISGWGTYAVLLQKIPRELGITTILFLVITIGSICFLPLYVLESIIYKPVPFSYGTVILLFFLGIIVSAGSIYLWNAGLRAIGPNKSSIFLNLIPVFSAGLAIIFLSERILTFHLIGAFLVFLGIFLGVRARLIEKK